MENQAYIIPETGPITCKRCPDRPTFDYEYISQHNAFHNALSRVQRVRNYISEDDRQKLVDALERGLDN